MAFTDFAMLVFGRCFALGFAVDFGVIIGFGTTVICCAIFGRVPDL